MRIEADFTKVTGRVKAMHGVGQPPMLGLNAEHLHYLEEAGIPYSRLHDVGGMFGGGAYVDIPNVFPDFEADENDPASYNFPFTDVIITELKKHGVEPVYRLGVTIENYAGVKAFRIFPPADFGKWARICEHIIRHYNEGWANGFHYAIRDWEIWNEADSGRFRNDISQMWRGTSQQFYDLYVTAATHLKQCFGDSIRVGGYASCGFYNCRTVDPDCQGLGHEPTSQFEGFFSFAHEFLAYVRDRKAPLDFFSWHSYASIANTLDMADYVKRLLDKYGFGDVPDYLNEWNVCHDIHSRGTARAAAQTLGMMLAMQKARPDMLNFYDARLNSCSQYGGLFNPDTWQPYLAYYAFMAFNEAYKLGNEVQTSSDDQDVYVLGATDQRQCVLLIANTSDQPKRATLALAGVKPDAFEAVMLNNQCDYRRRILHLAPDGTLAIPPQTCLQLIYA